MSLCGSLKQWTTIKFLAQVGPPKIEIKSLAHEPIQSFLRVVGSSVRALSDTTKTAHSRKQVTDRTIENFGRWGSDKKYLTVLAVIND